MKTLIIETALEAVESKGSVKLDKRKLFLTVGVKMWCYKCSLLRVEYKVLSKSTHKGGMPDLMSVAAAPDDRSSQQVQAIADEKCKRKDDSPSMPHNKPVRHATHTSTIINRREPHRREPKKKSPLIEEIPETSETTSTTIKADAPE